MSKSTVIRYSGLNIYGALGIRLQPQLNHFGPEQSKKVKAFLAHPGVVRRIKDGTIEVVEGNADSESKTVKDKTADELIAEVGETLVVDDLKAIQADEKAGKGRKTVLEAIDSQLLTVEGDISAGSGAE